MKSFLFFLCLVIWMIAYEGVGNAGMTVTPSGDILEITGTVRYVSVEGGFYGIIADDGKRYDPINLVPQFAVDGLRVRVKAEIAKDVASIRMWGKIVRILTIEKLE